MEDLGDSGTQIKFIMWLEGEWRSLVKPIRFAREQTTLVNHYYFADHERHTAEIAAFHLDRFAPGKNSLRYFLRDNNILFVLTTS